MQFLKCFEQCSVSLIIYMCSGLALGVPKCSGLVLASANFLCVLVV